MKPFLKWAGGKSGLVDKIQAVLGPVEPGQRLVEPFMGSCAVFMGTSYERYLLADTNKDLVNLYDTLTLDPEAFIAEAEAAFVGANSKEMYYELRREFNETASPRRRAVLFIYLNRHCFNGLCRYNRKGGYNVPYGKPKTSGFPKDALVAFAKRITESDVTFRQQGFDVTMAMAEPGDVIYCDPPYDPLSVTAAFTDYSKDGFGRDEQAALADAAAGAADRGIRVVLSNHDTEFVREIYLERGGRIAEAFPVRRSISSKGDDRKDAAEILAVFDPRSHPRAR